MDASPHRPASRTATKGALWWQHPVRILAGVLLLTGLCAAGLIDFRSGELRLRIDPSPDRLLPASGPDRELYERARRLFGTDEAVVVALGGIDVFSAEGVGRVATVTERIEAVPGVHHVVSLASAPDVRSVDDVIEIGPLFDVPPRSPDELALLRERVRANPVYAGSLVSEDGAATALLVYLERQPDRVRLDLDTALRVAEVARTAANGASVWVSGTPYIKALASHTLLRELSWMLPAIVALLAIVLFFAFRSVLGVVVPLVTIALALVWTLGTLAWLGRELSLVTTLIPSLILVVGFTYAMHVVSDYYDELRADPQGEASGAAAAWRALRVVTIPLLATGVTTAAGFLALALSPITAIREFGLYALLGVGFAVLAALGVPSAMLPLLPAPRARSQRNAATQLEGLAGRLARFSSGSRRAQLVGWCLVLAVALFGMTRIRVATEFSEGFDPELPVTRDHAAINEHFGGAYEIQILVESEVPEAFLIPANLQELDSLQTWLEMQPEIGQTLSLVDPLRLLNRAVHDGDPTHFIVPKTRALTSQLLLLGESPDTRRLVDAPRRTANVLVRTRASNSESIRELVGRIEARLAELPTFLRASVTGGPVVMSRSTDDLARGQRTSLLVAFALIYLVLVVTFTSQRVALLALLPNFLPIAIYFGALGWGGITLNPTTSLVGCLALGIAVDDTIHYFVRFNTTARRMLDEHRATYETLRGLIRPVTFTSLGLCLAFLVLTGSDVRGQVEFGLLAAFTLGAAWLVDVTLTPALCSGVRIVTLWDVLTCDLGPHPHRAIPLFEGLSDRRARIFALMSDIMEVPAGRHLIREGAHDRDIYVVLDGELVSYVARDGRQVELDKLGRGATFGEVGYFTEHRTANVDTLSRARLIRFDEYDLENLRRRHPRIAAIVYRNLNRIQAQRLVRTTARIR